MDSSGEHLSREAWILQALEVMDRDGIHGVKISGLAASLGVTKGSFYWHFESREDLLAGILAYWADSLVARIDAEVDLQPDDPSEELMWILKRVASGELNKHDPALRTWAVFDQVAQEAVRRVDKDRLEYKRDLFLRMGFEECEADLRSRLSYYYVVGEQVVAIDQTPETKLADVETRYEFLISRPAKPGDSDA